MCTIGTRLALLLQVLHYALQAVATKHCMLHHFHVLRIPQTPDGLSSNV